MEGLFFFEHEVHLFSIVELFPSLHGKFSVIHQFPCSPMHDYLDKVRSALLNLRTFCGFPFELDKPTVLHDVTQIFVIQVDFWCHTQSPNQIFFFPKSSCPSPPQPQIVFSEL